ncbi:GspH/FimT family pseudopilin [Roseovarius aestuariivivens]|uniref:GspH/FimT family pseudopilin n=1 Tax=Roseovarius aestuariivivens TaxID=1888910 RepID=UPI0010800BB8|nr:GspH/FimT family pseudopilin [Roseovarius aestuariivivens]
MDAGLRSSKGAGFTLIEVLIAVAVLAVLTLGAVLTAGRVSGGSGASDMARFAERIEFARTLAIDARRTGGLRLRDGTIQMLRRDADGWQPVADPVPWQQPVVFETRSPRIGTETPDILLLPNGQSTAFTLRFSNGGFCENDGWTGLKCSGG